MSIKSQSGRTPAVQLAEKTSQITTRSLWADAFRRLIQNRLSLVGLIVILLTYVIAVVGPYITPYDYLAQDWKAISQPPSALHWLGTDNVGRDYLSRLLFAMRTAVMVSILVPALSMALGVTLGVIGAYSGRLADNVVMRMTDVVLMVPSILFAALINATTKEPLALFAESLEQKTGWEVLSNTVYLDYFIVFSALALIGWPAYARLIRGVVLSLREQEFVTAARAVGATPWHVMWRHLVPNALSPIIVIVTFDMSGAMVLEASLSFLGIGIQPPGASLGQMINSAMTSWREYPHLIAVPAIVLAVITLAINFVGDGLNDALNPRKAKEL